MFALPGLALRSPAGRSASGRTPRLESWMAGLHHALRVMETRRELATLDERLLRDVGMTWSEARTEAGRAPWDMRRPRR